MPKRSKSTEMLMVMADIIMFILIMKLSGPTYTWGFWTKLLLAITMSSAAFGVYIILKKKV